MSDYSCIKLFLVIFLTLAIPLASNCTELKYPGDNEILIFAPGYSTPDDEQNDISDQSTGNFFPSAKHFKSKIIAKKDHSASLEVVKSFAEYGTIIMHTHGWHWDSGTGIGPYPGFRTGTVALEYGVFPDNGLINSNYINDLLFFRLAVSKKPNTVGTFHFVVLPGFIKEYVPATMPDSFIYLGYCSSLRNDSMWNAFKEKGAKVAFGWSRDIYRDTNVEFFNELMKRMLPGTQDTKPLTVT